MFEIILNNSLSPHAIAVPCSGGGALMSKGDPNIFESPVDMSELLNTFVRTYLVKYYVILHI